MTGQLLARVLATALAAASLAAVGSGAATAPEETRSAAAKRITASGVGGVKLGRTYKALRRRGLVGKIRRGCELAGPNTRSARLRAPLKGTVDFTQTTPRRVASIAVRRGATARGVGVGDTLADIRAAYPKAKVERGTEETFGITLVKIPKKGGGRLQFAIDTQTRRITIIGIPFIAFCE